MTHAPVATRAHAVVIALRMRDATDTKKLPAGPTYPDSQTLRAMLSLPEADFRGLSVVPTVPLFFVAASDTSYARIVNDRLWH